MAYQRQRGFSAIEVVVAVLVVAAIGATGYLAYNRMQEARNTPTASDQTQKAVAPQAPAIDSSKDLDEALDTLNNTNINASLTDSSDLDTQLKSF